MRRRACGWLLLRIAFVADIANGTADNASTAVRFTFTDVRGGASTDAVALSEIKLYDDTHLRW